MIEETISFPAGFYIAIVLLLLASNFAWRARRSGTGIPMAAVLGTVLVWYFGDALYNDYQSYAFEIGTKYLDAAWAQVALFIGAFMVLVPLVHRAINRRLLGEQSQFFALMQRGGIQNEEFQRRLDVAARLLFGIWAALMLIALVRTDFDFLGLFAPYVSGKAYPWSRGRVGVGFDALISFANYIQIMLTASFGIVAAVATNRRTRNLALLCFALSAPFYILDRARNVMLACVLPGMLAWVFLRLRGGLFTKLGVLAAFFLVVNLWMKFVIETRSGANIAQVVSSKGLAGVLETAEAEDARHQGLTMFTELAWINSFIDKGTFAVNYGSRYWSELVNPIPRALWPDKPYIGIDYAMARGQGFEGFGESGAGVGATISTGLIGQGVTNFGTFFGVLASALLMALWVAFLARQDLKGEKMGRMLLFFIGCVLTFNLGRDITLITLYPILFGYILLLVWSKTHRET
jgi:hypothetical protein